MLSTKLKEAAGNSADATLYVNDVFSTYLYTGNGSTQTITNGIDLAGKGGLVWTKVRTTTYPHCLTDTIRGGNKQLFSNTTDASTTSSPAEISSFNSDGYTLAGGTIENTSGQNFVGWTFRKAAKFFDVVTYTGNGVLSNAVAHNLGCVPGCIIWKKTNTTSNWGTWHIGSGITVSKTGGSLNSTNAFLYTLDETAYQTSTTFSPAWIADAAGNNGNDNGASYVAYLFAHNAGGFGTNGTDNIISCGSYVGNGSTNGPTVSLGWQPQYVMVKAATTASSWYVVDTMRGMTANLTGSSAILSPNVSDAEVAGVDGIVPNALGFSLASTSNAFNGSGQTYIYMAIRMPNKPPTTGTQVFSPIKWSGSESQTLTPGFPTDLVLQNTNIDSGYPSGFYWGSRLQGGTAYLTSTNTNAEGSFNSWQFGKATGTFTQSITTGPLTNSIDYFMRRAPGFFDEVCYTGTGSATTQAHNLGVVPELMIVKRRNAATQWAVYAAPIGATRALYLSSDGIGDTSANFWNNTAPISSVFTVGAGTGVNGASAPIVAYLFATLAGISKVGSYTGNGSSQNIECGFAAGARFFLVKATSTTGSWWVWDSARGITAGNDPALQLNSTAAEITTADAVDPYAAGITVNQEATCSINASGVSYIYLAIS